MLLTYSISSCAAPPERTSFNPNLLRYSPTPIHPSIVHCLYAHCGCGCKTTKSALSAKNGNCSVSCRVLSICGGTSEKNLGTLIKSNNFKCCNTVCVLSSNSVQR